MHHASVSYLPPIPRPPDLPDVKPVRPSLLYRIYRRLKNYWAPPVEGTIDVYLGKLPLMQVLVSDVSMHFVCVCVFGFRAPGRGRTRALGG